QLRTHWSVWRRGWVVFFIARSRLVSRFSCLEEKSCYSLRSSGLVTAQRTMVAALSVGARLHLLSVQRRLSKARLQVSSDPLWQVSSEEDGCWEGCGWI